jgi:ABC-type branched-subunit amino acid transport system substrate-binding protein
MGVGSYQSSSTARARAALMAGFAVVALGASACSSSSSSSGAGSTQAGATSAQGTSCSNVPSGPIKIGDILPLSGSTVNESFELAYLQTSVSYFNAHDSVCGRKFQIVSMNDKGDPALALSEAHDLVSAGVTIMADDSIGAAQDLIQPYLMQQHVLLVAGHPSFALNNPVKNPTDFDYQPSTAQDAAAMVNWAKAHGDNDIAILTDGLSLSQEVVDYSVQDIRAAGLHLVKTITYSPTAVDMTTQLTQAKQAGAKTLLLAGYAGINYLAAGVKQLGWDPVLLGWHTLAYYGLTDKTTPPGTVDGCNVHFNPGQTQSDLLTPAVVALLQAYTKREGGVVSAGTPGVLTYYSGLLMAQHAVEGANSLDGLKMAAVLNHTANLPTVVPGLSLSFSPTNHAGFPTSYYAMCPLVPGPYDILTAGT